MTPANGIDAAAIGATVVGRRRETEIIVAALLTRRNVLLEGPPGTGKSTLLRAVAAAIEAPLHFVEGNAELTPARLIGSHDPSMVLAGGYSAEAFVDGPLLAAMRSGGLLYVEEINRVPEETLNVLITAMSEREAEVPRLGRVHAADGFTVVAAMNPFDAVGTARISGALYDRTCRVAMGYQDADAETAITTRAVADAAVAVSDQAIDHDRLASIVGLVRATRNHSDLRQGASVRAAIDFELLCRQLAELRHDSPDAHDITRDAAQAALSGRIRTFEGSGRTAEQIVDELWRKHFGGRSSPAAPGAPPGKDQAR